MMAQLLSGSHMVPNSAKPENTANSNNCNEKRKICEKIKINKSHRLNGNVFCNMSQGDFQVSYVSRHPQP